jgi:hypothetical protein
VLFVGVYWYNRPTVYVVYCICTMYFNVISATYKVQKFGDQKYNFYLICQHVWDYRPSSGMPFEHYRQVLQTFTAF